MSFAQEELGFMDHIKTFGQTVYAELFGTETRARNTIGSAFLLLVLLRIAGVIGESQPVLGMACGG